MGLYEFGFAFAVALLAVPAFGGKPLIGAIMLTAAVRGVLSGVYEWGGPRSFDTVAVTAVGIFACAMYGGIAFLIEEVRKQEVLPVFRRSSKDSFEGDLGAQLRRLRTRPACARRCDAAVSPAPLQGRRAPGCGGTAVREGSMKHHYRTSRR